MTLTPEQREVLRQKIMAEIRTRMPIVSQRFSEWKDWPGTWAFADAAVAALQDELASGANARPAFPLMDPQRRRELDGRLTDEEIGLRRDEGDRAQRNADFEAGWRTAANWMNRDDLIADIGSPAYLADRTRALAASGVQPSDGGRP